jgi:hypothetical protein
MVGESRYNDDRKKAIGIGETASMLSEMEVMTFELSVKRERGEESTAARSLGCNPGERDDGDQQAQTIAPLSPDPSHQLLTAAIIRDSPRTWLFVSLYCQQRYAQGTA